MKSFTKSALVADALNLGPHWVYNQSKIARVYPEGVRQYTDPVSPYHGSKKAGDFTHIGDQLFFLHESIQANGGVYDSEVWKKDWVEKMSDYKGYLDSATKTTLETKAESPSDSDEVAGAGRCAPLLDLDMPMDEMIQAAKNQASLTHGSAEVTELAEFVVRTVFAIREGLGFYEAFLKAAEMGNYSVLEPMKHIKSAKTASTEDHLKVASDYGLTCHFTDAFPLTLYYAIHFGESFEECLSLNALAGGDNTARGILLAVFFCARDGEVSDVLFNKLNVNTGKENLEMAPGANDVEIDGKHGKLTGVLEMPEGEVSYTAVFAHCFTCGKDFLPEKRITQALAKRGIATLRIDFSGLGSSEGEFSESSFLTNLDDLVSASDWLTRKFTSPNLLVGHSLGGASVLAAAKKITSVKAVATIGAPSDPAHVAHLFEAHLPEIEESGEANVKLAGRSFTIGKRFLDDLKEHNQEHALAALSGVSTLIMHSPEDEIVPLKNAGVIYSALSHPKSFVSLVGADHLLTSPKDAEYVADIIKIWSAHTICG